MQVTRELHTATLPCPPRPQWNLVVSSPYWHRQVQYSILTVFIMSYVCIIIIRIDILQFYCHWGCSSTQAWLKLLELKKSWLLELTCSAVDAMNCCLFFEGKRQIIPGQYYSRTIRQQGTVLISVLQVLSRQWACTQLWMVDYTSSTTCRYLPGFYTGTKLYCLVTEAHGCEQLAQSCYLIAVWPGIELTTSRSWIWRPNHYATKPLQLLFFNECLFVYNLS